MVIERIVLETHRPARASQYYRRQTVFEVPGIALSASRIRVSAAEKTLERLEVSGGAVVIFFCLGGIAVFGSILGAGEIDFHAFLALGHVPAQAKARGRLLLLQTVDASIGRCDARCEMIDFVL